MSRKTFKAIRWAVRIFAAAIIAFGLPFYFGYGNPLPFTRPEYTLWDNMWLAIFPLMFIGLILGLKFERLGGYVAAVPVAAGLLAGLFVWGEMVYFMLVPLLAGILYLYVGYKKAAVQ